MSTDATFGLNSAITNIVSHFAAKKRSKKEYKHFQNRYSMMVADLERAGLNKMLAFGMPAGTPPSGEAGPTGIGEGVGEGIGSGMELYQRLKERKQTIQNLEQQQKNLEATEKLIEAETDRAWSQSGQSAATTANTQASTRMMDLQRQWYEINAPWESRLLKSQLPQREAEAGFYESIGEAGPWTRFLLNAASVLGRGRGAVAPVKPGARASDFRYRKRPQ